ncbi:MAG: hypothetical protein Q8R02_19960 [Hyphomonadaceae bacterium]|nr:hypothetical protein [Hyphomonadaceae bacterium]
MRSRAALIAALAVSLSLGASAGASPPAAPPKPEMDPQAKRITGSENYVPTFGLRATISRGFRVHGVLSVDAGLDIPDAKMRKHVEAVRPRLMSAMREAVLNYAALSYVIGERPDAEILRARLQKAVDTVLGKGTAQLALASVIVFPE